MFKFSQHTFFKLGILAFTIVAVSSTIGLMFDWNYLATWAKVSRCGSLLFNYALAYFFYWLYKTTPEQEPYYEMSEEEINDFLKKNGGKKKNGRRT